MRNHASRLLLLAVAVSAMAAQRPTDRDRQLALWKEIKAQLTGQNGADYFERNLVGALLPPFKGKVIRLEPRVRPKTVVLAIEDGITPDATLKFAKPLPGTVKAGMKLTFEGVPQSYTASPFMLVFNVDKDKLHGWSGKNARVAPRQNR